MFSEAQKYSFEVHKIIVSQVQKYIFQVQKYTFEIQRAYVRSAKSLLKY